MSNRELAEQVVRNIDDVFVDLLFDRHVLANMITAALDAAESRGREAERERCAQIAEESFHGDIPSVDWCGDEIAQAIREGTHETPPLPPAS